MTDILPGIGSHDRQTLPPMVLTCSLKKGGKGVVSVVVVVVDLMA